jgi:hypothetical protein
MICTDVMIKFSGTDTMTNGMIPGVNGNTGTTSGLPFCYAMPVRGLDIGGCTR